MTKAQQRKMVIQIQGKCLKALNTGDYFNCLAWINLETHLAVTRIRRIMNEKACGSPQTELTTNTKLSIIKT